MTNKNPRSRFREGRLSRRRRSSERLYSVRPPRTVLPQTSTCTVRPVDGARHANHTHAARGPLSLWSGPLPVLRDSPLARLIQFRLYCVGTQIGFNG